MIAERASIRCEDIVDLIEDRATAIRVPSYFPEDAASEIASKLVESRLHGKYVNAPEIGRVGQAFFESQADPLAGERYKDRAVDWIRELREAFAPRITPIDRFRLELDEIWPAGAQLATLAGRKMFVGLARTFSIGAKAEPHQDVFSWDAPASSEAGDVEVQIAMNVYLATPDQGGELVIYPDSFTEEEFKAKRIPNSYGIRDDALSSPSAVISPRVGELILFKANNVHAVNEIRCGTRVTWSCFVGPRKRQTLGALELIHGQAVTATAAYRLPRRPPPRKSTRVVVPQRRS